MSRRRNRGGPRPGIVVKDDKGEFWFVFAIRRPQPGERYIDGTTWPPLVVEAKKQEQPVLKIWAGHRLIVRRIENQDACRQPEAVQRMEAEGVA